MIFKKKAEGLMIRKFKMDDLNQIMTIWLEQNLSSHAFIDPFYFKSNIDLVRKMLPSSELYVQDIDGIRGFIGLTENYISGLFIKANDQNQGLGSGLIEKAKQVRSELFLNVYVENIKVVRFYEKHGFIRLENTINAETNHLEYFMGYAVGS